MQLQLDRYFDKVIVINSRQRGDRLKDMTSRFKELGMVKDHFEFIDKYRFEALMGGHVDRASFNITWEKGLNNGELGCYLSHLRIYQLIVSEGWNKTLILEDDALFTDEFFAKFEMHFNALPENWDMWYLGRWNYDVHNLQKKELEFYGVKNEIGNGLFESKRNWLTHAYAINKPETAKYLFENASRNLYLTIDGVLADLQDNLNVYSSNPAIVKQDPKSRSSLR
jgi:GR25 family glycosyltransferase involved in LPS biosynthesis